MNFFKYMIVIIMVLILPLTCKGYDYVNKNNAAGVEQGRKSIYQLYELYEYFFPTPEEDEEESYVENKCGVSSASSGEFIWPIGSDEVTNHNGKKFALGNPNTVNITSYFGPRPEDPQGHGALDIAPSDGNGIVNIIASKDGTVVYSSKNLSQCPVGYYGSTCGGGYGNYVVIKHDGGLYTLYAHIHQNTITVKEGDKVSQGQVIGKVGSSGSSTGTHLHFEFTNAQIYGIQNKKDPLKYVDPEKPRGKNANSDDNSSEGSDNSDECGDIPEAFSKMITNMEGGDLYSEGDYFIAYDGGDGPRFTIGPGLTNYASKSFEKFGYDVNKINPGTKIKKDDIYKIYADFMSSAKKDVEKYLSQNNINMNNNQILALVSGVHNGGNQFMYNVVDAYKEYGNTYKVYNAFCNYVHDQNGKIYGGLIKRRKGEWMIYSSGIYSNNPNNEQSDDGVNPCIGNFNIPINQKDKVSDVLKQTSTKFNGKISYY